MSEPRATRFEDEALSLCHTVSTRLRRSVRPVSDGDWTEDQTAATVPTLSGVFSLWHINPSERETGADFIHFYWIFTKTILIFAEVSCSCGSSTLLYPHRTSLFSGLQLWKSEESDNTSH